MEASFSDWDAGPGSRQSNLQDFVLLPGLVPNLQHLVLIAPTCCLVAEQHLGCLQKLTALQQLDLVIASNGKWQHNTLECLQHLPNLESLMLKVTSMGHKPFLLPPSFGTLTSLTCLALWRAPCEGDSIYSTSNIANSVSKLTRLVDLSFGNVIDEFPVALARLTELIHFRLEGCIDFGWLSLSEHLDNDPSSKQHVEEVDVAMLTPAANWLRTCEALACLPNLTDISFDDVDLSLVSTDQWAFSNTVTCLSFSGCDMSSLPAALFSVTSLQDLTLAWNCFPLPAGPYLEHLTRLDFCGGPMLKLSQALREATSLCELTLLQSDFGVHGNALKAVLPKGCMCDILYD